MAGVKGVNSLKSVKGTPRRQETEHPLAVAVFAAEAGNGELRSVAIQEGIEARYFSGHEEWMASVRKGECYMVLVDVTTFGLDGTAVVERLKGDSRTRKIPVVAFGDSLRADLLQDALEAGADLVLPRSALRKQWKGILRRFRAG